MPELCLSLDASGFASACQVSRRISSVHSYLTIAMQFFIDEYKCHRRLPIHDPKGT
jgi:hypothetical protein